MLQCAVTQCHTSIPEDLASLSPLPLPTTFIKLVFFSSFFLAGRVFSPALRPYMIGPMRTPDIQNLLEVFASLKREKPLRGLCKPKERSPME